MFEDDQADQENLFIILSTGNIPSKSARDNAQLIRIIFSSGIPLLYPALVLQNVLIVL